MLSLAPDFEKGSPRNIVRQLYQQGFVEAPIFSFKLDDLQNPLLYVGSHKLPFSKRRVRFKQTLNDHWAFRVDKVHIDSEGDVKDSLAVAILNSDDKYLRLPLGTLRRVNNVF